jgi:hypothetical protein
MKEYLRHTWLYHQQKSAVAQRVINICHRIHFHDATILARNSERMKHIVRLATETVPHPDNTDREEGSFLSKSWERFIQTPTKRK